MASSGKRTTAKTKSSSGSGAKSASAKKTSTVKTTSGKNTSGTRKTTAKKKGVSVSSRYGSKAENDSMTGEIIVILLAAFCIFLFCSNLNLCGQIGQTMKNLMRGTMGVFGYAFPVFLPVSALLFVLAKDKLRAGIKLAVSVVVYTIFCGIVEMIHGKFTTGSMEWIEFYHRSLAENGGGLAGGMWCKLLYPSLGLFGSYLILVVLALVGLLLITEKSLLAPIKRRGGRMIEHAREDLELRREEKELRRREREAIREEQWAQTKEERRYRMDNPVKGVARNVELVNNRLTNQTVPAKSEHYQGKINDKPVSMTGEELEREHNTEEIIYTDTYRSGNSADAQKTPEKPSKEKKNKGERRSLSAAFTDIVIPKQENPLQELTITGLDNYDHEDVLTAKQESRTHSELESLDSLRSGFSRRRQTVVPDALFSPEDNLEYIAGDGSRMVNEISGSDDSAEDQWIEDESIDNTPLTISNLRSRMSAPKESAEAQENLFSVGEPDTVTNNAQMSTIPEVEIEDDNPHEDAWEKDEALNNRGNDTLRIVTAGGRVIEVDNDPTTDPLAAKRAGLSQGQAAMTRQDLVHSDEPVQQMPTGRGTSRTSAGYSSSSTYSTEGQTKRSGAPTGNGPSVSTPKLDPVIPKKKLKPYEKPPLRLLNAPQKKTAGNRENDLRETAMKLQQTLQNFGVGATVTNISCGPSVTRYELIPDQGVKVSRFLSLTDDIKLNLAAADIRMEAPIPGKSAIGIEVPNTEKTMVCLREVMECEDFLKHPSKLAIAVGKDIAGNTIVADIARMPHLLVAGTTGSGKSVFVNTMIVSILYKATPDEVKFIMIDPKMVEFRIYNGIPHLLTPVVTDPKKAAEVLGWAVVQMTDRYKKFAELNVRDIKGYNERKKAEAEDGEKPELMPQIVIVVDELSDLMMAAPSEVEDAIVRLAQMARAAGIHLILATQRPSVNVVTGLIKANIPSRVALSVSTGVDSRTIIDMNGAEKLLGNGDMLFYPSGYQKPLRVQGAFVSDKEILQLVEFLSERGEAKFDESLETKIVQSGSGCAPASDRDEYFADAGRFVLKSQKASIGNLQRMFKIGFNRAARIMDQLAEVGVVGPEEGTKARKILMTPEEFENYLSGR